MVLCTAIPEYSYSRRLTTTNIEIAWSLWVSATTLYAKAYKYVHIFRILLSLQSRYAQDTKYVSVLFSESLGSILPSNNLPWLSLYWN